MGNIFSKNKTEAQSSRGPSTAVGFTKTDSVNSPRPTADQCNVYSSHGAPRIPRKTPRQRNLENESTTPTFHEPSASSCATGVSRQVTRILDALRAWFRPIREFFTIHSLGRRVYFSCMESIPSKDLVETICSASATHAQRLAALRKCEFIMLGATVSMLSEEPLNGGDYDTCELRKALLVSLLGHEPESCVESRRKLRARLLFTHADKLAAMPVDIRRELCAEELHDSFRYAMELTENVTYMQTMFAGCKP